MARDSDIHTPHDALAGIPPQVTALSDGAAPNGEQVASQAADRLIENAARAWQASDTKRTLFETIISRAASKDGQKTAIQDSEGNTLTYKRLVLGSLILGAKLSKNTKSGEAIGVLLPNVAGLAVTVLGLNAHGRVAAMLNFTAGPRNIVSAVKTSVTRKVVTSRRFVDTAKLHHIIEALEKAELPGGDKIQIVYLEDVRKSIGAPAKALGAVRSLMAASFHRRSGMTAEKPAVILFTSGTEGAPKGVVLSNANLIANAHQIFAHANGFLTSDDTVMNPLPMFHSFGLTAGTLMPLIHGMSVVLYPSPLHYKQIPQFIKKTGATVLFATDTFLQGYARAAGTDDLKTVRFVVAGAERVKDATRELWKELGTDIQEGYGATECAPVIACNLPPINTYGTVGPVLPGIDLKLEPVEGITEGGRLKVRGPNVMMGYLFAEHPGVVSPPEDGWHDTGDIVTVTNGMIAIRGRAKRFAKIGGEMVSLAAVEALAADLWPDAQHVVVSRPDPRKGEQLILATDKPDAKIADLSIHARKEGFPELWVPRAVMVVGAIPILGSGKVDLPATIKMVQEAHPFQ